MRVRTDGRTRSSIGFFGLLVLLVGIGALLDVLGWLDFWGSFSRWWPGLVIAVGVLSWFATPRSVVGPALTVVVGAVLLAWTLGLVGDGFFARLWPSLVVLVGVWLLVRGPRFSPGALVGRRFKAVVVFAGAERAVRAGRFDGGDVTAVLGGMKLDLRRVTYARGSVLTVFAALGGVEIIVRENVHVQVEGTPILGRWEDKTRAAPDATEELRIRGTSIMGEVEIRN